MHRIVYFECGKYKFRVGENNVKTIGTPKEQPGLWVIEFNDGRRSIVLPTETVLITEEEHNIVVPEIIMADGSSASK